MRRWLLAAVIGGALLGQLVSSWAAPKVVGSGGVGGTCATANSLGKFSSAFTLGCSGVTDDGTNVTLTSRGLRMSADNAADIGGSHTTLRPANVWVGTLVDSPRFTTTGTGSNAGYTLASNESIGSTGSQLTFKNSGVAMSDLYTLGSGVAWNDSPNTGSGAVVKVTGNYNTGSGSSSVAFLHVNPTINSTSSGTAYGLGVASKTNTMTGGTIRLASFGTTTTDLFTGYTAKAEIDTNGTFIANNLGGFFSGVLTNTAAYTAITGSGCGAATECFFAIGSDGTIPAGSINAAKHRIELEVAGVYGANATDTLTLNFKICTVSGCGSGTVITLATTAAVTMGAATAKPWNARIACNVFTSGASGTLDCQGIPGGQFYTAISTVIVDDIFNSGTVSVDTTVAEFVSVSATWSSTNAANTITLRNFGVKVF